MSDTSAAVYVVDDDVSVRESVEGLIHSADFRVETFATARDLLDRFRDEVPGCLVLDVNLPGVGGLEVQQELATADLHVPVIFITGHGDIPTSVRAMKSGALEFLRPPRSRSRESQDSKGTTLECKADKKGKPRWTKK